MLSVPALYPMIPSMRGTAYRGVNQLDKDKVNVSMAGLGGSGIGDWGDESLDDPLLNQIELTGSGSVGGGGGGTDWGAIMQAAIAAGAAIGSQAFNAQLAANMQPGQVISYTDPTTRQKFTLSQQASGFPIVSATPGGSTTAAAVGMSAGMIAALAIGGLALVMIMRGR